MKKLLKNAKIYNTEKKAFEKGAVLIENQIIEGVYGEKDCNLPINCEFEDLGGALLAPGLIDLHTHGRAGGDFVSAEGDKLQKMAQAYLSKGVTTLLPTLASATLPELQSAIERIALAKEQGAHNFAGVHLEGRYLNKARRGAHAEHLLAPLDGKELEEMVFRMREVGHVHISAALELDGNGSFLDSALQNGATVGLAHSNATYAEAKLAFDRGAVSLTHTYNAMSPFHHRDGGCVGAGLLTPQVYCEIIADGFHVSPEAVKLAHRMKGDRLILITDSMEATGEPDGEYSIAGLPVTVKDGKARTHEGAIAGSTLDLLDGVKNLAAFADISFAEALYHATAAPAKMARLDGTVGSIEVGKKANLLVLNESFDLQKVIFEGEEA